MNEINFHRKSKHSLIGILNINNITHNIHDIDKTM